MKPAFRVSICGGGIGGLTLALVLGKYGIPLVEIFEAGPTITTVGSGIGLYGRTMDIMKELGLYDELVKLAIGPPQENTGPVFRKSDQRDGYHWFSRNLKREDVCQMTHGGSDFLCISGGTLMVHRKDLLDLLLQQLSVSCKIHTSKKLELYNVNSETGEITLHFSDGSSSVTDVLVGADGIHSVTRKTMYQKLASLVRDDGTRMRLLGHIDPVWTGILVYRSLVPTAKLLKEYPDVEGPSGLTMHIVTYPISQGGLINVVVYRHNRGSFGTPFEGNWVVNVSEKEISDRFEDWEVRARALAKCVERPLRWALHTLQPLPHYVDGRVVLLGDAAHAMEPHLGVGAGQAIEDAFVLGRLLTHKLTHQGNVTDALKTYEEVRLPIVNSIAQRSQNVGRYYGFRHVFADGSVPAQGSPEELDYMRKSIEDAWEWQSESAWVWGDAEECWRAKCDTHAKL
ncbi:hypothetical protein J3R83DRAFT_11232 [Lanmaoa asiatica]|nr:hypothetical protein J3R83DRAFT_11232 [Lanmaoa asiatica]